jgi:hypothetical protein
MEHCHAGANTAERQASCYTPPVALLPPWALRATTTARQLSWLRVSAGHL